MTSLYPTPMPVGVDVQVNTVTASNQQQPSVAALADGGFVTIWMSLDEVANQWALYARRYDSNVLEVGGQFQVNTSALFNWSPPSVKALADGGFVVAWTSNSGAPTQVYGQRFGSDGTAVGSEFRINSNTTVDHNNVALSGLSDGGFVAAWAANGQDGSLYGIYGQRYKADGAAIDGEFRINSFTTGDQVNPALATIADGGFVATWSSSVQDGGHFGIYGQRFASNGTPVGSEFRINTQSVGQQPYSSPAALSDGGFVVTWTSFDGNGEGISGQRYGSNGAAIGAEFRINTYTNDTQNFSSVTALSDGGFVVTWSSKGQDGSGYGIYGQRFTADALPAGGEFRVNDITDGNQIAEIFNGSALATLANGRLVQVWSGLGTEEVFFTLIDVPAPEFTSGTTGSIAENASTSIVAYDADATSDGPITYSLSGVDSKLFAIDPDNGQVRFLASPNFEVPADKGGDNVYDIVVHARDGLIETTRPVAITVTDQSAAASKTPVLLAGDVQVNSYTAGAQFEPAVTSLSGGGFVVTWTTFDGSDTGIAGQRYAEGGTAIGNEFKVNTYTTSFQTHSSVTSLSDGGFVVTWSSRLQDGDGYGVYGQRYAEDGKAVGSEFKVNTSTTGDQFYSPVASLPDGGFVVTWMLRNQDGSGDIFGQRYAQDGSPVGGEFKVNTPGSPVEPPGPSGSESEPAATSLSDGGFLVTWKTLDASSSGIFGQRYGADGTAHGGEFKVNTYTTNVQSNSSATSLPDGGFVVTWSSLDQDGSGYGIYGQRYAQSGSPVNGEFRANTETGSDQRFSSVTSVADGGFVVTWTSSGQDGSGSGVYGQRYAADGTSMGGEFRLNQITAGNQGEAILYGTERVTSLNDGHLVQVWSGTGTEVFFRRVEIPWGDGNAAPSITSDGGQEAASVSVAENTKAVTTVVAHDTDAGQTLTYSLAGGADAAAFTIDGASGALSFAAAPDFEAPADANKDNVYDVVVKVSDGAGGTDSQAIGVTVTDVNTAPAITSGAAGTVAENAPSATVVYDAAAKDDGEDHGTLTYSLAAGGDSKLFDINAGTGQVTFKAPADFDKPGDADGNNVYEITVQASDGSLVGSQAVSITVTDQNDVAPVITTAADLSVAENTLVVAALTSTDVDTVGTNPAKFSVSGGADAALFDVADGNLVFKAARDFETDPHSYQVEVTASDGVNHSAKLLTVTLTDFLGDNNSPPSITSDGGQEAASVSVAENTKAVTTVVAHDTDDGQMLTYSLAGGADAAAFAIDGASGALSFAAAPDFEAPADANKDNVYEVVVKVSDGAGDTDSQAIGVTVTNANTAPAITSGAAGTVAENAPVATVVYDADATDDGENSGTLTYSLAAGGDNKLFDIDAGTGQITFKSSPDFEVPGDADGNNVYEITVRASDGSLVGGQVVSITVTDQNDNAPVITSEAALSVAEGTKPIVALTSTDPDTVGTNPMFYSISGGADGTLFEIIDGSLEFAAGRDYETEAHSYQVEVTAGDGVNESAKLLTVTLTDQNDTAPEITTEAALSVAENTLVVAALNSTDVDTVGTRPAEFSVSGGADASLFDVAGSNLVFKTAPDFETDPHSYEVEVTASDGVNHSVKLLTVALTDLSGVTITGTAGSDNVDVTTTVPGQPLPTREDDVINGLAGNDSLNGLAGNDRLDGGTGADAMSGGPGNDNYVVDDAGDAVTELPNEGIDTVEASVSYTLGSNVERLTLTGDQAIDGTGNSLANQITGNEMANRLDGGTGQDTLTGLGGNDTYIVDDQADVVTEVAGGGVDLVISSAFLFALPAEVENLTLAFDAGDAFGVGNGLANTLVGNAGVNTLIGNAGSDTLDGGAGADYLLGGAGNDLYRVDDTFDLVDEGGAFPAYAGSATDFDTISSTAEWFWDVYSVGERLQIEEGAIGSGGAGTTIVGSVFSNEMIGNSGNNIMFGRGGADTYRAGDGVDWISLSLLGVTEQNAYVGVDGVNTIIVDKRTTGALSYDIIFEFEAGKDKIDVSSYGYANATEVLQHGHDDGRGNSYYALGDGFDYVYLVGVTTSQVHSTDFVV